MAELGQPQDAPAPRPTPRSSALGSPSPAWTTSSGTQFSLPEAAKGVVITASTGCRRRREPEAGRPDRRGRPGGGGLAARGRAKVNQAKQEGKKSILLLIDRQGDLRFVALRLSDAPPPPAPAPAPPAPAPQ